MTKRNPFAKDLPEVAQGLREQGTGETEPLAGTTSYTSVIRGAGEAETMEMREPWHRDLILGMVASRIDVDRWASSMAYTYSKSGTLEVTALIVAMRAEQAALTAEAERLSRRLMHERDEARAALKAERVISRSRDAIIDRLWAQLNEATNAPHNDPEFGYLPRMLGDLDPLPDDVTPIYTERKMPGQEGG